MIVEAVRVGCENSPLPLDSTLHLSEQYPVTPDDQGKGVEGHVVLGTAAEVLVACAWVNIRLVGKVVALPMAFHGGSGVCSLTNPDGVTRCPRQVGRKA